jgi:hypothetical protein
LVYNEKPARIVGTGKVNKPYGHLKKVTTGSDNSQIKEWLKGAQISA